MTAMNATGDTAYVFARTREQREFERLQAIERIFDPQTRRWLLATGLRRGWDCLEVGAGAGSVAKWMRERVGDSGRVVALDTARRFLSDLPANGVEVLKADVRTAPIEPGTFDLVHARFVLIHVAHWRTALNSMIKALRPGGWLVLEEPDFASARAIAGPDELRRAFENVNRAIEAMFSQRGLNYAFGARIPSLFQNQMFQNIRVQNSAPIERGGSPVASMMRLSTSQLREKYLATDFAGEKDIRLYEAFTCDPACWAIYHGTVRGVGCKSKRERNAIRH